MVQAGFETCTWQPSSKVTAFATYSRNRSCICETLISSGVWNLSEQTQVLHLPVFNLTERLSVSNLYRTRLVGSEYIRGLIWLTNVNKCSLVQQRTCRAAAHQCALLLTVAARRCQIKIKRSSSSRIKPKHNIRIDFVVSSYISLQMLCALSVPSLFHPDPFLL